MLCSQTAAATALLAVQADAGPRAAVEGTGLCIHKRTVFCYTVERSGTPCSFWILCSAAVAASLAMLLYPSVYITTHAAEPWKVVTATTRPAAPCVGTLWAMLIPAEAVAWLSLTTQPAREGPCKYTQDTTSYVQVSPAQHNLPQVGTHATTPAGLQACCGKPALALVPQAVVMVKQSHNSC
jgi:hypothetical protein